LSKCNYARAKVAIIKDEGRIEFYPTLNSCRMRIKAKESAKIKIQRIRIQTVHVLVFKS